MFRRALLCVPILSALILTGCGQSQPPVAALPVEKPTTKPEPAKPKPEAPAKAEDIPEARRLASGRGDFLHQPFQAAVRQNMPANGLPPLTTVTGKSVGKLYGQVEKLWPTIRFVDEMGRKLQYVATLHTEHGPIEIELLPDVAPNHVRSFVALAQSGYYDSLFFETRIGNPTDSAAPKAIAGGSPAADGDDLGSIGYWLLPEILLPDAAKTRGVRHQPGTVAAVHGVQQLDTDGCRFFICLSEAPTWDGEFTIFGKVKTGLDVAEKLFQQPVIDADGSNAFFQKLPIISKVTISVTPLEKEEGKSDNKN